MTKPATDGERESECDGTDERGVGWGTWCPRHGRYRHECLRTANAALRARIAELERMVGREKDKQMHAAISAECRIAELEAALGERTRERDEAREEVAAWESANAAQDAANTTCIDNFDAHPDAQNFLAWRVTDDRARTFEITVQLVGGKTVSDRMNELSAALAAEKERREAMLQGAAKVARDLPLHDVDSLHVAGAEWAARWIVGDDVYDALSRGATADPTKRDQFRRDQQAAIAAALADRKDGE